MGPDNDSGDITGSGTAITVTKFTSAKVIGNGPITFATNDSTFAGDIVGGGSITIGSGGAYNAGAIFSDANWGMIF